MLENIIIYTDLQGRVYPHQNQENTLIEYEVEQLPTTPEEPLKDGYLIYLNGVFTFGYELNVNKCYGAINDLKVRLRSTDYIDHKDLDSEDVTKYGDYKATRRSIRLEINRIEELIAAS